MNLALAVLPILLTIACGYIAVVTGFVPKEKWDGINKLSFQLLIPITLVKAIAVADLSTYASGAAVWCMLATVALAGMTALSLRLFIGHDRLPNPSYTTLFQTTTRWNAYIALAAAEQFAGGPGMALIAIAMAILVPTINISNVVVLSLFGTGRASVAGILGNVVKNPIVIGCALGLAINLSGATLPAPLYQTLDVIGRSAVGVGLLAVGAGISLRRLAGTSWKMWLGVVFRLGLCPAIFFTLAHLFGLGAIETLAIALVFAVPAASNGYIIAQHMGGDTDLYADIMTWQTVLSVPLLPLIAIIAGHVS